MMVVRRRRSAGALVAATLVGCAIGDGATGGLGGVSVADGGSAATDGTDGDTAGATDGSADSGPASSDPSMTGPGDGPGPGTGDDGPGGEVCNGLDDDGDGTVDDGIPDLQCGVGACAATVVGCDGGVPTQCFPGTPTNEVCNGLDDDCDGAVDQGITQACDSACGPGTQTCIAGSFGSCDAPPPAAESCNVADDDCNGQVDDGVGGCRVDIHRWSHPVTGEHFYSTDVNEGNCCGFQLEFAGYFELYAAAQASTTGFYRCYQPGGFHHYTTDANCEGLAVNEGIIGYIGTADLPGSTELYRSYNPANGDHFFTTSADEHGNVVGALGFVDEGVVGWVW